MILGYASIIVTVSVLLYLVIKQDVKPWQYYGGIYLVGALLLLATTQAGFMVGSDVHLEYYYAKQFMLHGWDRSLPCSINSCLSVSIFPYFLLGVEPDIRDLPLAFKVYIPLLYALVPVLLLFIYSRFMPIKGAFLAAIFFITIPTFFLEMPQVARQMIGELLIVGLLAVLISNITDKFKTLIILGGSLAIVLAHYSSAIFWMVLLVAIIAGYLIQKKSQAVFRFGAVLAITALFMYGYSQWSSSAWQAEDIGNTIQSIVATVGQGSGTLTEIVQDTAIKHIGATEYMLRMGLGLDFFEVDGPSKAFRLIQILTEILLVIGIVVMLLRKEIPTIYKALIIIGSGLLGLAVLVPVIASTINPTRFYHLMLMILAPALVFAVGWLFKSGAYRISAGVLLVYFVFTSGLVFHFAGYQDISRPTVPYSIALENERLDAGNYLTRNDDMVAAWAFDYYGGAIYADVGGTLISQHYYDLYHALPLKSVYKPGEIILVREWNTEHSGWSSWVGPGLRQTVPLILPGGQKVYQSGKAYLGG